MQVVILTAGRGKRLRPLTYHVPKPMIKIAGKNLLEHNIERLPDEVSEIIFVVGYLGEQIINHFGNEHSGRKITYVKQQKLFGTGHALHSCKKYLKDRFLVMMGDDLYSSDDILNCLKHEQCMLVKEINSKFSGGRVVLNSSGNLNGITEGTHNRRSSLVNAALYVLTDKFFNYKLVQIKNKKEYGLPQTIVDVAKDYPVAIEKASDWLQITDLASLRRAEDILTREKKV